ncbi:UDP-glucose 4-epimerase [archaeon BMS3Abin16]|nr:UDP-glucose 4-epimerase [archaeon BMS3Abin16]
MGKEKKTVLVTGSSGRIGYPLAKRLAESFNVVGFDRRAPSHPPPTAECLYVDLSSEKSVRRGLDAIRELHGNRIASVIHLAAYYDFSGAPSPLYEKVTVQGTRRLLQMLQDFEVEQFIFSSTDLVHKPSAPGQRINEDSPLEPKWDYPKSKVKTEELIHAEHGKIPAVIVRIAGVYDDLCNSLPLANQIQRIYEHDPTAYIFPGDTSRGCQAFVHKDDLIEAIIRAVERRHELPSEVTLLMGEPESLSYGELQRAFGELIHGVDWKTYSIPPRLAKIGAWAQEKLPLGRPSFIKPWMIDIATDNIELDITRARTVLDWEPKHNLRDTLPKMILALKADPFAWYRMNGLKRPLWLRELAPSGEMDEDMGPHELMKLGDEVKRLVAEPAPKPMAMHSMQGMMDMSGSGADHMMHMGGSHEDGGEESSEEEELEELRKMQAKLDLAYQREIAAQKKEDAKAHELMDTDPKEHIKMMRMEQIHRQLALTLPRILLEHEQKIYQKLLSAKKAASAKLPDTAAMMGQMVGMARWTQIPIFILGLWLIVTSFTFTYSNAALMWSDIISGFLLMVISAAAFRTGRVWTLVANSLMALWLAFAPLVFWTPVAAAYLNDTMVSALVIFFAIIVPMMMRMPGDEVPSGWNYNPSSWLQRAPVIVLAFLGFAIARYLAAFQLGHIQWAWDPFFGVGTVKILTSNVSRAFPISDGGLGTVAYMIEFLMGFMGDTRRWRTMPWMVTLFGILIVPLGIVSITLIILQPIVIGYWCTLCLVTGLGMLVMIPFTLNEVAAMILFLILSRRAGRSLWRTFWLGGNALEEDDLTPHRPLPAGLKEMFWGVTVPWNLLVSAVLGVWLMAAPAVFKSMGWAAHSNHLLGALVVTVSIIAFAEVVRPLRFINIGLAIGIILAPWLAGGGTLPSSLNALFVGLLIIVLSIPPGKIKNTYGSWNSLIL